MNVGYTNFDDGGGSKKYAYVVQDGQRFFLRNVAFITNPSQTKLLVVHNLGSQREHGWEPPKGICMWDDFAAAVTKNGYEITFPLYKECMRKSMEREVTEEAKVFSNELRNVQMLPYAYYGLCDVQHNTFMYQFWAATITEKTIQKAQQRQRELHTNPDWVAMVPPDITETDKVAWWSSETMHLTHGPAEKMTRAYLKLLNKHSDNV